MITTLYVALQLLSHHPDLAQQAVQRMSAPGAVNQAELRGAVADAAHAILTCYHRTARMEGLQDTRQGFAAAPEYGAEQSEVLVIHYAGVTGRQYAMEVALMARGSGDTAEMRAVVMHDTAVIPYARGCPLQDWTSVS